MADTGGYGGPPSGWPGEQPGHGPPPGYGPPGYGPPPEQTWGLAVGSNVSGYEGPDTYRWGPAPPPPTKPEQPSSIKSAVALMWGGAALTLFSIPVVFVFQDEIRDIVRDQQPTLTSSELDLAVTIGTVGAVVGGAIGIALWALNAVFCGRGHAWSRILGTALFGISILALPFNLSQPTPGISRAFQVMSLLVSIGAVIFLWLPESNRFFRESDRARRGY